MKKLIAIAFLAVGCQTTQSTIVEPERSRYYVSCLSNQIHVTTCNCMEAAAVKETGLTNPAANEGDFEKFVSALEKNYESCNAATQKQIEETNGKAEKR